MEIKGLYTFEAPLKEVWEKLLDTDSLARCMPGCESLTPIGDDQYEATMSVGVGSVMASYRARITISDRVPERSYRMLVEGNGPPGFLRGEALVSLEEREGNTLVKVDGEAQVGGTIASFGQRLLASSNKIMMDKFFACMQQADS